MTDWAKEKSADIATLYAIGSEMASCERLVLAALEEAAQRERFACWRCAKAEEDNAATTSHSDLARTAEATAAVVADRILGRGPVRP